MSIEFVWIDSDNLRDFYGCCSECAVSNADLCHEDNLTGEIECLFHYHDGRYISTKEASMLPGKKSHTSMDARPDSVRGMYVHARVQPTKPKDDSQLEFDFGGGEE